MTIALTTPRTVPDIRRIKVMEFKPEDLASFATITLDVLSSPATGRSKRFTITVRNGDTTPGAVDPRASMRLIPTASMVPPRVASRFDDDVATDTLVVANAYDEVDAAYRSAAGSRAAAFRAVEQKLLDLGLIHADLGGVVS